MNKNYYTLFLIKKDMMHRGLMGCALYAIESRFKIKHFTTAEFDSKIMAEFYAEHKDKPFFNILMTNVTGQIGVGVLHGDSNIVSDFREYLGHTDPQKSAFGSLRGRFGLSIDANAFHGSDSESSFIKEVKLLLPNLKLD
jgi:nucleoside-diphosphate kinase